MPKKEWFQETPEKLAEDAMSDEQISGSNERRQLHGAVKADAYILKFWPKQALEELASLKARFPENSPLPPKKIALIAGTKEPIENQVSPEVLENNKKLHEMVSEIEKKLKELDSFIASQL